MRFVSLGPTCETQFQIARLQGVEWPFAVFDKQITDFSALIFCLENNFDRAFLKEFMCVRYGVVRDMRFEETAYPHAFGGEGAGSKAIDVYFDHELAKHQRRLVRFRDALCHSGPVTCLRREALTATQIRRLTFALRRFAGKEVGLVVLGNAISPNLLPRNVVSRQFTPRVTYGERWQGDDVEWDAVFRPLMAELPDACAA